MKTTTADMSFEDLAFALDQASLGDTPTNGAVQLLIRHEMWLQRRDFRDYIVLDEHSMARIDWSLVHEVASVGQFAGASRSQHKILAIACTLATAIPPEMSLRELITGLDSRNFQLVLHALTRAAGWLADGRVAHIVDGSFDIGGVR